MTKEELIAKVDDSLVSIRPYLEADGGNVKVLDVVDGKKVILELLGACSSCSMSSMTMKAGIEEAIKKSIPQIEEVEAVNMTPLGA